MDDPAIEPLAGHHDRSAFSCGEPALDAYLQRQASQDMRRRVAQVFVAVIPPSANVIGFYGLSATHIERSDLPPDRAKRLPHYPVPAAILGRLAIDGASQGRRLGELLLLDALRRVLRASTQMAVHAIIVDARNERAQSFYERFGFRLLPTDGRRLFLPLETVEQLGL